MATAVSLAPFLVERTSADPLVREYYGPASLQLPAPASIREAIFRFCCCGNRKAHDLPLKVASFPQESITEEQGPIAG
jgi:hypothetical protein